MNVSLNLMNLRRRHCISLVTMLSVAGINAPVRAAQAAAAKITSPLTILVLGDSLSAEYGLKRGTGWVALLEKKLASENIQAQVVNASISGDTTSGGRARLPALLRQHQPRLVVIELGANDALRGLPLTLTHDNLTLMTRDAQQAGAKVLLLGMQMPPNYGRDYGQQLTNMYAKVAKTNRAALVPFFLKGVADGPDSLKWFQADRIHPLEAAHPVILANIWPELKNGLR